MIGITRELRLPLKKKWFDLIKSGVKKEEYREITPYWSKRIWGKNISYTYVHFTLGYPKNDDASRHMIKRVKEIVIGRGRCEWGAESDKEYFVIKLED